MSKLVYKLTCLQIVALLVLPGMQCAVHAKDNRPKDLDLGSTPQAVYRTYNQAQWRLDVDTVLACLSSRVQISREDLYDQILLERKKLPQVLHLLHAEPGERIATLYYLGIRVDAYHTGKTFYRRGAITFVQEYGHWRIRHESWQDISSDVIEGQTSP